MTIPASQDSSLGFLGLTAVLRTHPRVYVNGIIIGNPHYQADQFPG
jgi:hypothetical protein